MQRQEIVRRIISIYLSLLKRLPFLDFLKHTVIHRIYAVSHYIIINNGAILVREKYIGIGNYNFNIQPEDYADILRIKQLIALFNSACLTDSPLLETQNG